jgi:predicted CXXCH cytochrome family protein
MVYVLNFILITLVLIWSSGSAFAQVKLKVPVPDLCYKCHKELKKDLADKYTHFLFKQGKCTVCHNSHVSNVKGLMNDEINPICLNCHEKMRNLLDKAVLHSALRDGVCTDCHYAHSGSNKHLLVSKEKMLCLNCHENINKQIKEPYACLPFKEGNCSECHNSHASVEDNLLTGAPVKLCQKCHLPKCTAGDVSIASVVKGMDCTSCHSGHASKDKGLLGPYGHTAFMVKDCKACHDPIKAKKEITTKIKGQELCFSCHKKDDMKYTYLENDVHVKDVKKPCNICHDYHASENKNLTKNAKKICLKCHENTEKRTAFMEKALGTTKCTPVRERKCFDCHIPVHSDLPLDYRADGIEMCARCHKSQHEITHPLGNDVIDPRDGKPITCISCHSMHAARDKSLLTFDKDRALCIQCHKM